jgi:hypothetical protein
MQSLHPGATAVCMASHCLPNLPTAGSENQFLVQGLIVTEAEKDSPSSIGPVMSVTASLLSKEAHKD